VTRQVEELPGSKRQKCVQLFGLFGPSKRNQLRVESVRSNVPVDASCNPKKEKRYLIKTYITVFQQDNHLRTVFSMLTSFMLTCYISDVEGEFLPDPTVN
jgi:hypothetical protein